ncbi:hypothetical protein ONA70_03485 [Micromonospora yasonensis]|uniref:hypothetical protein n=1 Tax=Micromonospora yasonensis TaxID=1128667 RepID=UPI00222F15D7|nr:hypothetical protein [Micromonospora yasonensis]MCW3839159.1 hypothetical protein [Micromonospora yasonensis]
MDLHFRKLRSVAFRDPFLLRSGTHEHHFQVKVSANFRAGGTPHKDVGALVRRDIYLAASAEAMRWQADEAHHFEDALNAEFGLARKCKAGCYRRLTACFAVKVAATGRQAAIEAREDKARVERLRALKVALYSDPALFLISQIEKNPNLAIDQTKVDEAWRISGLLRSSEDWWAPVMRAWGDLARGFQTPESASIALKVLVDCIERLDRTLIDRHRIAAGLEES